MRSKVVKIPTIYLRHFKPWRLRAGSKSWAHKTQYPDREYPHHIHWISAGYYADGEYPADIHNPDIGFLLKTTLYAMSSFCIKLLLLLQQTTLIVATLNRPTLQQWEKGPNFVILVDIRKTPAPPPLLLRFFQNTQWAVFGRFELFECRMWFNT